MIPLFCVLFLKVKRGTGNGLDGPFYRRYRALLLWVVRHRFVSVAVVVLVFFASLRLFATVPVIFFPPNDRPTLTAELRLPTGTPLAATQALVDRVESFVRDELWAGRDPQQAEAARQGVASWASFIGEGAPRFILSFNPEPPSPEYALLLVNVSSRELVDEVVLRLREFCDQEPGLEATIDALPLGPPSRNPVEVRVSGREADQVFALVDDVKGELIQLRGTRNIGDDWGARSKKVEVRISESRALRAGVTNQDIALSLMTTFSGFRATEFREHDKVIPVVLRSNDGGVVSAEEVGSLNVFSQATGRSVPVAQVADFALAWQPSNIRRRDRLKTVAVFSDLEPGVTAKEVSGPLAEWLATASHDWPPGYSWKLGGEEEESAAANQSIVDKLPIAALLIVLLLVAQFNSLRRTLIILITVPLGVIGVAVGLVVMRSYFGFMTLLGIISLAGIVINNAIVLLDRIKIEIDRNGLSPQAAVITSTQQRLRPILLTTFTTLGGLVPLYLGGGPMYQPMAVAIMFGLIFATLLTLGVVPVLYSLFFRVDFRGFDI